MVIESTRAKAREEETKRVRERERKREGTETERAERERGREETGILGWPERDEEQRKARGGRYGGERETERLLRRKERETERQRVIHTETVTESGERRKRAQ